MDTHNMHAKLPTPLPSMSPILPRPSLNIHYSIYSVIVQSLVYYACIVKRIMASGNIFTPPYLHIWHQLRHKHTWPLLGLLTGVLAPSLKFLSWEACDPSKSPKDARQREMVLPDLERGPQRWTSCGEENILSWIRGMFVYQGRCAAPRRGERRILRKGRGKCTNSLCNIHKI